MDDAFGLPLTGNSDKFDPLFCISCSTLWREVTLQVRRWLAQNESTSLMSRALSNELMEGWIELVASTMRIHQAVSKTGELPALIAGEKEGRGRGDEMTSSRSTLEVGLDVEKLFSHFTIRWIEMQYDRFCKERIPHLFEQAKWQPLSDTDPNYRYDQTAKDLRFLIDTLSMSFDQVPGHTKYPSIVRYGQNLVCDVVTYYADQVQKSFAEKSKKLMTTPEELPVFNALFGLGELSDLEGDDDKTLAIHARPLTTRMNTVLHLQQVLMELLENLNKLDGVEGFMEFEEEEEEETSSAAPTRTTSGRMEFGEEKKS